MTITIIIIENLVQILDIYENDDFKKNAFKVKLAVLLIIVLSQFLLLSLS